MIGDIGLMIGAYIVFRVFSEFATWEDDWNKHWGLGLLGIGVILVVVGGVYGILTSSASIANP